MAPGGGPFRIPPGAPRYPPPDRSRRLPVEDIDPEDDFNQAKSGSLLDWLLLSRPGVLINDLPVDPSSPCYALESLFTGSSPSSSSADEDYFGPKLQAPVQNDMVVAEDRNIKLELSSFAQKLAQHPNAVESILKEGQHLMAPKQGTTDDMQAFSVVKNETVFYNSATSHRSVAGKIHYCMSCPGWNKVTDVRYVYSRWEWTRCCYGKCNCVSGRQLDQFNADLIVDISAHQNLCQICRGEGDMVLHKLAGGDLSDSSSTFILNDVPDVATVFQQMTFRLSRMNLKGLAAMGLGRLMGAVTWTWPAGMDGPATKTVDKHKEAVYYDSETTKRTCCGYLFNAHCCAKPQYKITSERVLYTEWDFWYLCDDPAHLACFPFYSCFFCCRASMEDMCCCAGDAAARIRKMQDRQIAKKAQKEARGCCDKMCSVPVGRTYKFFDMDIVADVGAHQNCSQLALNEGDLQLYRLVGGDIDNSKKVFLVKDVPEVFSKFDDLSYVMSQMDLTHFRQSAIGQRMMKMLPYGS